MQTIVYGRREAHGATFDKPWAVISIRNPDMTPLEFECPNLKGVLHLAFDDIDKLENGKIPFTIGMANQVWDFIQSVKVDILLVHCIMGLSRSPGIAAAIDKILTGDDSKWFATKVPNRRVFTCMLKAANERYI